MRAIPIFQTETALPIMLGKHCLHDCEIYDEPEAGINLTYESYPAKTNVYLYDNGFDYIPEQLSAPELLDAMAEACECISQAEAYGMYQDVEFLGRDEFYLHELSPHPMYLWACFRYCPVNDQFEGISVISHLFMRADGGYFNKVRYTYPEALHETCSEHMMDFLLDWTTAVARA